MEDRDGDGIPDHFDKKPKQKATSYKELLAQDKTKNKRFSMDRDKDGIPDHFDKKPKQKAVTYAQKINQDRTKSKIYSKHSRLDRDGDRIPDRYDKLPYTKAVTDREKMQQDNRETWLKPKVLRNIQNLPQIGSMRDWVNRRKIINQIGINWMEEFQNKLRSRYVYDTNFQTPKRDLKFFEMVPHLKGFVLKNEFKYKNHEKLLKTYNYELKKGKIVVLAIDREFLSPFSLLKEREEYLKSYTGKFIILYRNEYGELQKLFEGIGATHPSTRKGKKVTPKTEKYDINKDKTTDIAWLPIGKYRYSCIPSRRESNKKFAFFPKKCWYDEKWQNKFYVWRDSEITNKKEKLHNGTLSKVELKKKYVGDSLLIHEGGKHSLSSSKSPYSLGCMTMPPKVFKKFRKAIEKNFDKLVGKNHYLDVLIHRVPKASIPYY